jgi:hypothetical protein
VLAALALIVVGVVAAVLPSTRSEPKAASASERGALLTAAAVLSPASQLFASALHVRVDAVVDRTRLDPDRVFLDADWKPYEPSAAFERTRTDVGSVSRLRWVGDVRCVVLECAPDPGSVARKELPPAYVRYRPERGTVTPVPIRITWPALSAFSRLDPINVQRNAIVSKVGRFNRLSVVLPPWQLSSLPVGTDSRRLSPTALFWLALLLAGGLVVAALGLARPWLPDLSLRRRTQPLSRLEQALATVERSPGGTEERRKALELLAEELRSSGRGRLAGTAKELAWSAPLPEGDRTAALTAEVRRDLGRRTNGHRL